MFSAHISRASPPRRPPKSVVSPCVWMRGSLFAVASRPLEPGPEQSISDRNTHYAGHHVEHAEYEPEDFSSTSTTAHRSELL